MSAQTIRFSFDYVSNNAYLAWTQLPALAARFGCTIEPIPVLFAGLLQAHGTLGPAEVPAKSRWMVKNILRKAMRLAVPMNAPAFHPFNPLLALRVSSLALDETARHTLIDALFKAVWVRSLHVSEPAVVTQIANEIGLDGAALVAQAARPETKERLRRQTDDAIARGVFGVPSMEVGDELFWGYDDFPRLEMVLAGDDPLAGLWLTGQFPTSHPSAWRKQAPERR
jgi:2-hydroxychromene-2-carboxylate isomerase